MPTSTTDRFPSETDGGFHDKRQPHSREQQQQESPEERHRSSETFLGLVPTTVKSSASEPHSESPKSKDNDLESQEKQVRPFAKKWVVCITLAGFVVSGLVLVIVLSTLLSPKSKPSVTVPGTISSADEMWESEDLQNFHKYVANNIKGTMNASIDPCENFYEYACGNWMIHNLPPKGVSRWSNFEDMTVTIWDMMQEQLDKVAASMHSLPNKTNRSNIPSVAKDSSQSLLDNANPFVLDLVGVYYNTCENETHLNSLGAQPLKDVLDKLDIEYDAKSKELLPLKAFQHMLEYVHHELSVHVFFGWKVEMDNSIADSMVIELIPPSTELFPQGTTVEGQDELITIYKNYAQDILKIVGTYKNYDTESEADTIVDLLKVYQPLTTSQLINVTSIIELDSLIPFLNWQQYFNKAFNKVGTFINKDERILSLIQDYLINISEKIMLEINTNGSHRLYSFIRWQVVQYYCQFLHKPARNTILPLFDQISGENTVELPNFRYRPCIKELEDRLALPMAYLLLETVKRQLPDTVKIKDMIRNVEKMALNIRKSYKSYINSFQWLRTDIKKILTEKINSINFLVGYPSILNQISSLKSLYKPLQFSDGNLMQNQINLLGFNQLRKMRFLRQPHTYTEWEVLSPMSLISFYVYRRNALLIPLGGFMHPLYSADIPEALSYATMGVFIAHEIGHSIDFVGRTRDQHGRTNATLWDEVTVSEFVQRVLCRVNEYTERYYPIEGLLTIAEVMADDGSVGTSYQTIHHQLQHLSFFPNPLKEFMNQQNLSPNQLFFLYYAQLFCTTSAPGVPLKGIDHYPPHPVRVQATLANTPAFHKAFNCPKGSYMNPIRNQTCDIW